MTIPIGVSGFWYVTVILIGVSGYWYVTTILIGVSVTGM
jgi:hypothetical protein